ncbi:LOW QUALITY PROTEIN: mucosa-associated lymphoid tissue lymphoma translocation protein 1-like [Chiroxiphia lanceolata]|uniref:LOW QUALITY PROTEIN: mucosa-associated lymphoid tissue lymphoma translocation protein 1-like n=1 Tax=Chiroxiphia lanceolata TaxID=296741 RepID=UPI0013CED970|nr:LOW QUALITY PROTEIN: mucosa-associated lymphoid tissue lymphoma translocation protein 1-like [Chiroxiphia lanceolata]
MGDWSVPIGALGEEVVARLCELLDNAGRGWRKLAELAGAEKRFKCSAEELEMCSLKVLEPRGSPTQCLLQLLAERDCTLKYLLGCLEQMGHTKACRVLSAAVQDMIHITVQPESQVVVQGTRVSLTCCATGPPGLMYQWFCGKREVPGATSPELVIDTATPPGQPEWYICRVNCGATFAFSRWAHVQVEKSSSPSSSQWLLPEHGRAADPAAATAVPPGRGGHAGLECRAIGNPPPQYQWFRNRRPVEGAQAPQLQVKLVTTAERGSYCCRVFNLFHEVWSQEVDVEIGPRLFTSGGSWQEGDGGSPECGNPGQLYATDKVALLIGNMHYLHHKQLQAPMVDVHALSALLRQLDFKVVSLLDLCKAEMQMAVNEFLLLLDKGVYGLLYYAGHGYENFGNSFMVPIDAPSAYTSAHCLCVQRVLRAMQERRTGLNTFLLDMCRKRNLNDDVIPQVGALEVTANIVFGYATCADAEAYELSQGELSNGIFVTFLKRWLLEDEKITVLLDKVAEDMGTLEITRGRQALELRSNLSERRALTDPIRPPGRDETSARNLQWAKAHVLPESRHLRFDCGVTVQLGFAAEFSNIMIIYTRVVAAPTDITKCEARLTDIPEELDVDLKCTNKESPEEVGSPLAPVWSLGCPSCCLYSRICGLQKLRQELAFTVCLQYRYRGMDDFVEERQRVSVGRPLIAKLNLQQAASPSPPRSPLSSSPPESWGATGSSWVNTPEENLSPDVPSSHTL